MVVVNVVVLLVFLCIVFRGREIFFFVKINLILCMIKNLDSVLIPIYLLVPSTSVYSIVYRDTFLFSFFTFHIP